jgi:hypothetical protein
MTERSIQTRCTQMHIHPEVPFPCSECYSIEVTSRRLPEWAPPEIWHTVPDDGEELFAATLHCRETTVPCGFASCEVCYGRNP